MSSRGDAPTDLPMPLLLADALRTYGMANRAALAAAGFDDVPRAGAQVIGRLARGEAMVGDLGMGFGPLRRAGELVDVLVARGYVNRTTETEDPIRARVALSERGVAAAAVIQGAVEQVDATLLEAMPGGEVDQARSVLGALASQSARARAAIPELGGDPMTREEALDMRGSGWEAGRGATRHRDP